MPELEDIRPRQSGTIAQTVADFAGGTAYGGGVEEQDNVAFGGPTADFILYGVVNGAFAQGPPNPNDFIDPQINPMPYWAGPTQVSGGAIQVSWVADANSPSGYNLRFTINPGAASDEAYMEQIVPIGGSRATWFAAGIYVAAPVVASSSSTFSAFKAYVQVAELDASMNVVTSRSAVEVPVQSDEIGGVLDIEDPAWYFFSNAESVRIRIGVKRSAANATDSAIVDFSDIRLLHGGPAVLLGDAAVTPGRILQTGSQIQIYAGLTKVATLDNSQGLVLRGSGNIGLTLPEDGTPPLTPASGSGIVYAKSDGHLYFKNDAGTEIRLDITASGAVATRSSGLSLTSGSQTTLTWPTEDRDTDSYHSTVSATNRMVAPFTGWYAISVDVDFDAAFGTAGRSLLDIFINADNPGTSGYIRDRRDFSTTGVPSQTVGGLIYLNAGDYLSATIDQISGGTRTVTGHFEMSYLTGGSGGGGNVATDTIWAAKGDLAGGTGADTAAALTVGANDTILMADSAQTTGLKWGAAATVKTALGYYTSGDSPTFATVTTTGDIELGNASDTTLHRVSAGVVSVEGSNILVSGGALGTPSSGTLTNATGLPIAGLTASTSTALGVGSIELGHASDTTLARVSAGVMSIEGGTASTLNVSQVAFPATQNSSSDANTLDDYEEGSWTPVLSFTTAGSSSWVHSVQVGRYTKIGRIVNLYCNVTAVFTTGAGVAGNLQVTGLPFTATSLTSGSWQLAGVMQGYTKANYTWGSPQVVQNTATAQMAVAGSAQTIASLAVADIPSGGTVTLHFAGPYEVPT